MKLFLLFFLALSLYGAKIQIIKKENKDSNTTLLVIGGIHGNEPGGYFAPAILAMHYKILSKNLWIVPNLNQESIQANKRGINGDMNRKFAHIKKNDKDKEIVQGIKNIILSKEVSLVLNLHDGHGFYRKDYQGSIFNPNAWGQTCVIDQCKLNVNQEFGNLNDIAKKVMKNINKKLIKKHHSFNVKNTNTKFDDEAMRNSLTYFAVTHNKPAFAIETSKNLKTLSQKVFYQLMAIEEFMNIMGIKYKRDFELNIETISKIIRQYGILTINDNIKVDLSIVKKVLRFMPIKFSYNKYNFTHPLGSVKKDKYGNRNIYIGNKKVTILKPEYFKMADGCPKKIKYRVDKKDVEYDLTSTFFVNDDFLVKNIEGIRVNIIGFSTKNKNEVDVSVSYKDLDSKYAIYKDNRSFRIEFYKDDGFCGMAIARFKKEKE